MNVIKTLFILIKSNADDVVKGNERIEKSTKELKKNFKDTNEEINKVGDRFTKTLENFAGITGVWAASQFFKNNIKQAIEYNSHLEITSKLYGVQAQQIKGLANAAQQFGGNKVGALTDILGIANAAQNMGISSVNIQAVLQEAHNRTKKISNHANKINMLKAYGFTDAGLLLALSGSDAQFKDFTGIAENTPLTTSESAAALKNKKLQGGLTGAMDNFFNTLSSTLLPAIDILLKKLTDLINLLSKNPVSTLAASGTVIGAGGYVGIKGIKSLLSTGGRQASSAVSTASMPLVLALAGLGEVGYAGYKLFDKDLWAKDWKEIKSIFPHKQSSGTLQTGKISQGMDFFIKQGYSKEQAAAIMGNLKNEGLNGGIGDNGLAEGIAQWHPDRAKNIFKNTGIDISNAPYEKQLEAVYWEMQHGRPQFSNDAFKKMGLQDASNYFTSNFETPRDILGQSLVRGKSALQIASNYSGFSNGQKTDISIGNITINTQATDSIGIAQNLKEELYSQMVLMGANFDDGRAK